MIVTTWGLGTESLRAAAADPAAVLISVIRRPSSTATGEPFSLSNTSMTAWWVGIAVPALP